MSASKSSKPGVYLIVIDGLPEQYTWQDLKDFVRPEAEHEFWADLAPWPTGSGRKKGCIRTQRWKEAGNLYKYLTRASVNGTRLNIVLWDISQSPPKQIAPNPAQLMTENQAKWASNVANASPNSSAAGPGHSSPQSGSAYATQQTTLAQSMEGLSLQHRQQQQAAYYAQQQQAQQRQRQAQAAQQLQQSQAAYYASQAPQPNGSSSQAQAGASRTAPQYVNSYTGTPINVRDGVALTVSRGIFVSGINFKAREEDVKHKFSKAGDVVKCALQTDASTGKSKGVATVLFASSAEAQKAIDRYNDSTWMDKKIKVRIDKESTTLAAPPRSDASPLIVNGSRVR